MRIISGKYRGKAITLPGNFNARPTTDFAREGLFNILENNFNIENLSVLDLFSGTGSISYEFASRGCRQVHLYEINRNHFRYIIKTIKDLRLEQVKAFNKDVFRSIPKIKTQFDIIFADPPYDLKEGKTIPDMIFSNELLKANGWLILEHPGAYDFSNHEHFIKHRNYGSVHFSFFE
ncbi:MAG: RsmD family RNA methyltransferase [Bacteroidota bacterium]|nr:RsmD family RNA methyltransferase [Bacteroidota bacterium]